MTDVQDQSAYIQHLEKENARWQEKCADMQNAYKEGDRVSQLRGWAIDRTIEFIKASGSGSEWGLDELRGFADHLVAYTFAPQEDAINSVELLNANEAQVN